MIVLTDTAKFKNKIYYNCLLSVLCQFGIFKNPCLISLLPNLPHPVGVSIHKIWIDSPTRIQSPATLGYCDGNRGGSRIPVGWGANIRFCQILQTTA